MILLISAYWVARITGVSHWNLAIFWFFLRQNFSLMNFYLVMVYYNKKVIKYIAIVLVEVFECGHGNIKTKARIWEWESCFLTFYILLIQRNFSSPINFGKQCSSVEYIGFNLKIEQNLAQILRFYFFKENSHSSFFSLLSVFMWLSGVLFLSFSMEKTNPRLQKCEPTVLENLFIYVFIVGILFFFF
jgi:hypothetical protein